MESREIDTRESVKVVTSNRFISAVGLEGISLKARKLLYIAISQVRKNDDNFYDYEISAKDFAKMMKISPSHVYEEADKITDELMRGFIKSIPEGKKKFVKYNLFSKCEYTEDAIIRFRINKDMTDFLLGIGGKFSQPLLNDFMVMKSPYSMQIWHLMQREMNSKKPKTTESIDFFLSLDELRQVTGTKDKLLKISNFKNRVLNKALREISDNCGVDITYQNHKKGKTVVGFDFVARSQFFVDFDSIKPETLEKVKNFKAKQQLKEMAAAERQGITYETLDGQLTTADIGI